MVAFSLMMWKHDLPHFVGTEAAVQPSTDGARHGSTINLASLGVGFSQFDCVAVWRQRFVTFIPEVTLLDMVVLENQSIHRCIAWKRKNNHQSCMQCLESKASRVMC